MGLESLMALGELTCWARRGSRDGPWVELPAEAWLGSDRVQLVGEDFAARYELRDERRVAQDGTITYRERKVCVEPWFELRFAPAQSRPPPYSPKRLEQWVINEYVPSLNGRTPPRAEMVAATKAVFPAATKRHIEDLKRKYLPGKPGAPRK